MSSANFPPLRLPAQQNNTKVVFLRGEKFRHVSLVVQSFIVQINSKPAKRKSRIIYSNFFLLSSTFSEKGVHRKSLSCESEQIRRYGTVSESKHETTVEKKIRPKLGLVMVIGHVFNVIESI